MTANELPPHTPQFHIEAFSPSFLSDQSYTIFTVRQEPDPSIYLLILHDVILEQGSQTLELFLQRKAVT